MLVVYRTDLLLDAYALENESPMAGRAKILHGEILQIFQV